MLPHDRNYVHGYQAAEGTRLNEQATALESLLHAGIRYPPGSRVLEVGCGVGAQTVALARNSPGAEVVAIDRSAASLAEAAARTKAAGARDVTFLQADIFALPFEPASFDHLFVCFVLEHLSDPLGALARLRGLLQAGGTITVVEGDHGSAYFHPDGEAGRAVVAALVKLQRAAGGDPNIGRRIYPLLATAGFTSIDVAPIPVYVDGARPELAESFTRRTFMAMIEGVRERAVAAGLMSAQDFEAGLQDLRRSAELDGVFCYTFFRGRGARD